MIIWSTTWAPWSRPVTQSHVHVFLMLHHNVVTGRNLGECGHFGWNKVLDSSINLTKTECKTYSWCQTLFGSGWNISTCLWMKSQVNWHKYLWNEKSINQKSLMNAGDVTQRAKSSEKITGLCKSNLKVAHRFWLTRSPLTLSEC